MQIPDDEEGESRGTIQLNAGTAIGECGDFLKAFPSFSYNDYMFKLSIAKILMMSNDITHPYYMTEKEKDIWKKSYQWQKSLETMFSKRRAVGKDR